MAILNALFLNRKNGTLELYDNQDQQLLVLRLNQPWLYFPFSKLNYLTHIRIINPFYLEEGEYETTPDTLIIIDPNILVNSRAIASAHVCPRQSYLQYIRGDSKPSLPMIRGLIIHDIFSLIVTKNVSVAIASKHILEQYWFQLSYLNVDLRKFKEEILPVIQGLAHSAKEWINSNVIPEMTFLSPLYGIMGRIDFWTQEELFELKTGKKIPSVEINTWTPDLYQTLIYMHGLSTSSNKAVSKSYVIYSGIGVPSYRSTVIDDLLLQNIHIARNHCYLFQYEDYIPPVIEISACRYCFVKDLCVMFENLELKASDLAYTYFQHFMSLLRQEHLKNRQDFSLLWKLNPRGRIKLGKAISDISLVNVSDDSYTFTCNNHSELKPGEPVIFSNGIPTLDKTMIATVTAISQSSVTVRSYNNLSPYSFLDAYSSDFNYRRLNKNVFELALGLKKGHKAHKLVIRGIKPAFTKREKLKIEAVDKSQLRAIQNAVEANDYCLIQGPAGTGKTYTITKLIDEFRKEGKSILLTSYTNTAVDNILINYLENTRFKNEFNHMTRLGIEASVSSEMIPYLLKNQNLSYEELLKIPIIAATTSTISKSLFDDLNFDVVIVDEATQMAEPHLLSAIAKGKKFILVGDDKQLPPLVQSQQAENLGLGMSLFTRLKQKYPDTNSLLRFQYRMNKELMNFSNQRYYEGQVEAINDSVAKQLLWELLPSDVDLSKVDQFIQLILDPNQPLVYVGIDTEFNKKRRVNLGEIKIIRQLVETLLNLGLSPNSLGIIAPFRGQVAELRRSLKNYRNLLIDTIDRFQGSDKEMIILSLCSLESPHLLEDERRLNVALTRAKKKMIILGNRPREDSITQFRALFLHIQKHSSVIFMKTDTIHQEKRGTVHSKTIQLKSSKIELEKQDKNEDFTIEITHNTCVLCLKDIKDEKYLLRCPICNQAYHNNHLEEWLLTHESCVVCHSTIQLL
ncbi:MAG: AAA domain-containing protein [Candidatus Hodarchaeales archaeon]|jgi:DNA replication ATP-dependent helicase Dna2